MIKKKEKCFICHSQRNRSKMVVVDGKHVHSYHNGCGCDVKKETQTVLDKN